MRSVLIVDDDPSVRMAIRMALEGKYLIYTAATGADALKQIETLKPEMVLLDIGLPDIDGFEVLHRIKTRFHDTTVIMITAVGQVKSIVETIRMGAYDYLVKPVDMQELHITLQNAFENRRLHDQITIIQKPHIEQYHFNTLGNSPQIKALIQTARKVSANSDIPVLITGESGSGKGVMARAIHYSGEKPGPFLSVNCGAIAKDVMESELFGYERGAFTGAATEGKKGYFEAASGGTLLLDEIDALSISAQAKFLGVLEERSFYRVGGSRKINIAARIIATTNIRIEDAVTHGYFRKDLFYRLNVLRLNIPPLRDRKEDIAFFIQKFMLYFNRKFGKHFQDMSIEAGNALLAHPWPGNIRELRNVIERIILLEDGDTIQTEHLPFVIEPAETAASSTELTDTFDYLEAGKSLIQEALRRTGGNVLGASRLLNLPAHKLRYRIKKFGISL